MNKRWLIGIGIVALIGLVVAASLLGSNSKGAAGDQVAEGQAVYQANCAACHGVDGEGEYPESPMMPGPDGLFGAPPHNEFGHTWHHADGLLIQRIKEGGAYDGFKVMPAFGESLTDEEIESVLAYLKTLWTEEQREIQADVTANQPQSDLPAIRDLTEGE